MCLCTGCFKLCNPCSCQCKGEHDSVIWSVKCKRLWFRCIFVCNYLEFQFWNGECDIQTFFYNHTTFFIVRKNMFFPNNFFVMFFSISTGLSLWARKVYMWTIRNYHFHCCHWNAYMLILVNDNFREFVGNMSIQFGIFKHMEKDVSVLTAW